MNSHLLLFVFLTKIYCFNIDLNSPIVYVDPSPSNKSSYFGYSSVLHPGDRMRPPWVLIGAPRANTPSGTYENPGAIFNCPIGKQCQIIDVDSEPREVRNPSGNYVNKLDGAWIGGSMDINYKHERVVTCGYRWTNHKRARNAANDDYRMLGSCYWFHVNDNTIQKLIPLLDYTRDIYTDKDTQSSVYYYAQGEAGFSLHMPEKEKEILLGAPGVYNWDGTSILYQDTDDGTPIASRYRNKRYVNAEEFDSKNVANAIYTTQTVAYDLLGYASTSGYFYNHSELFYVSGAPKSKKYHGQVLIYKFSKSFDKALEVKQSKKGSQFGEYFGGSLTAGDINGDGYDDLIVGAPFHSSKRFNEGRIYTFLGSRTGSLQEPDQSATIDGSVMNGQFGTTLQYLGDLNHDNFGDIAVSAPYEETSGVVYIFRGTRKGLDSVPCQRIVGKDISAEIRGFGISIARPADIDDNAFKDLAIGAYKSGHTILLRSRPVITIYHKLETFSTRLDHNTKDFKMSACFSFDLDQKIDTIKIKRIIKVDEQLNRAFLGNTSYEKEIQLSSKGVTCEVFIVALKNTITNRYNPLTVSIDHELITEKEVKEVMYITGDTVVGVDRFCPRCPVYDAYRSSSPTSVDIPFTLGCGSDNICNTRLEFEPQLTGLGPDHVFVLGSADYLELKTTVRNLGERAFSTEVVVALPDFVNFRQIPSFCLEQNVSVVKCNVENPLETNAIKSVSLELDMANVNTGKYGDSLNITVTVLTSSQNSNKNIKNIVMKLTRKADITISGKSGEQSYPYGNETQGKPNFTQIYQVEKFGISPIDEVRVEINIPHSIIKDSDIINFIKLQPPIGNLGGQPISCFSNFSYILDTKKSDGALESVLESASVRKLQRRSISDTENNDMKILTNRTFFINCTMPEVICSKVVCRAGPFKSNQIAAIEIKMFADINPIKDLLGKKDMILLATHGSVTIQSPPNFVQSGDKPDSIHVTTLFVGDTIDTKVEIWIIVVSVIAGLLILLLVILGLVKAGFFKRKTKEQLELLKKESEEEDNNQLKNENDMDDIEN